MTQRYLLLGRRRFEHRVCKISRRIVVRWREYVRRTERRGATATFFALILPVVLGVAAYAINVVYMELARTELQISVDVATRAAGRVFATTQSQSESIKAAERLLAKNPFANKQLNLQSVDIVFGVSTRYNEFEKFQFTPNGKEPNAVSLEANGKIRVQTLFPTLGVPVNFRPVKGAIASQAEIDIALMLDCSTSMVFDPSSKSNESLVFSGASWLQGTPAPLNSRWVKGVGAVELFIEELEKSVHQERLAIGYFNSSATLDSPLDEDYSLARLSLFLRTQIYLGGKSNLEQGLLGGMTFLADSSKARTWASRVVVILSDGLTDPQTNPIPVAQTAAGQNIYLYTVSISDEANISLMKSIARTGNGKHYHANNGSELKDAFRDILRTVPMLITD